MKLTGGSAKSYLKSPDPSHCGVLIFGADPMRVADARQAVILALAGRQGEAEMRITRIAAGDLRKDPARLDDAMKSQGFFAGARVAFIEDATDAAVPVILDVLSDWQAGDAHLVVSANMLTAKSKLRKLFEVHKQAACIGIYDDPPSRSDVEGLLKETGLNAVSRDAVDAAFSLAQSLEPGDFRQTLEKTALYKWQDPGPLSVEELLQNAPQSADVDLDDICDVVASGRIDAVGPMLRNLYAQGVLPVTLCIGLTRYFRRLHTVSSDPSGAEQGVSRLRPPAFGPRRAQIVSRVKQWGAPRLEQALTTLLDVDLKMRSAGQSPDRALMERALIRLAMLGRGRR